MEVLSDKEELMKAYWLGELQGERLDSAEIEWFGNDEDSQLLEIVRMDLIDDYIGGDLEIREKALFEKNFLANNFDDVVLGKFSVGLSRQSDESKRIGFFERFLIGLKSFGRIPQLATVAGLVLICFGFLIVLLVNNYKDGSQQVAQQTNPNENADTNFSKNSDVNQIRNPPTNDAPKSVENANVETNSADRRNEKTIIPPNRDVEIAKNIDRTEKNKPAKSQIVLLTILRGDLPSRKISGSADGITLKLDMPGLEKAYHKYELRILDSAGNTVFRRALQENLALKKSGEQITVSNIKTDKFKNGEKYKTVLVGIEKTGEEKPLGSYINFEKNKK